MENTQATRLRILGKVYPKASAEDLGRIPEIECLALADRFIALAQERLLELTSGVGVAAKAPVKSGPEARMIELKKALGTANHNIQSNITLTKRASATILRLSGESGEIATLRVKVIDLGAEGKETKEALASLAALRTQLSEAKLLLEGDAKKRTLSLADKLVALQKIKAKVLDEITATAKQLNPEQLGGMFTNQELKKLFTPEELAQTFTGDILSQIPTAPSKAAPLAPAPASSIVHAAAPSQSSRSRSTGRGPDNSWHSTATPSTGTSGTLSPSSDFQTQRYGRNSRSIRCN